MSFVTKILLTVIIIISFSCGYKASQENLPDLSHVNKIILTYKTDFDSTGKMNLKSIDVTDPKVINSIEQLTSSRPTAYLFCISTGVMSLYNDSEILINIVFNTSSDFRHIAYNYNNKLIALELSEENAKLLESFKSQITKN